MASKLISKHFRLSEFACHDGSRVPARFVDRAIKLASVLDIVRDHIDAPLHVLSGYRTPSWNTKVGGAPASKHMQMKAADVVSKNLSAADLHVIFLILINNGKIPDGGLGLYKNFVHYDLGPSRRWSGV